MKNCILSCLQGLQRYWAFMKSFDIGALRFEFWHKFFPPWHYSWKFLSVHCDRKLIIIPDIWWIAFIKVSFLFFFPRISRWPLKSFRTKGGGEKTKNFLKKLKMIFLSPNVNPPLVSEVWTDVSKWRKCRGLNSPFPLAPANKKSESTCVAVPGTLGRLSCIRVPNPWFITRLSIGGCKWKILKATFRRVLHSDVARGPCSLGLCPVEKGTPLLTAPVSLGAQGLLLSVM